MNMKEHILSALREQFARWEELLTTQSEVQLTTPPSPHSWSVKDDIAHLWAWQQRSIARLEAAAMSREPAFPTWLPDADPDATDATEQVNAWLYTTHRDQPWSKVHQEWQSGFRRFLALAEEIPERDLLDGERYPWLGGFPLAVVLLASYDHHQEHLENWLARPKS